MPDYAFTRIVQRDQLQCLEIHHPFFRADILLQGAQLIYYRPAMATNNWLWLSSSAEYKTGQSLRGGIPICWPWFGNALQNPSAVQQQLADPATASAHGFARNQDWQLDQVEESCQQVRVRLSLLAIDRSDWHGKAKVSAEFIFNKRSCQLTVTTHNLDNKTLNLSQALHSYFPTGDIHNTRIYGLESCRYADALINHDGNWKVSRQNAAVSFSQETDRVYFPQKPRLQLQAAGQTTNLYTDNSRSCVVWNPWVNKAKRLSQFDNAAYKEMFCIETANVLDDAVSLPANEQFSVTVRIEKG